MIALVVALLCSAFPIRGNIQLPATSPLVIDKDTVRLVEGPRCVCICAGSSKGVNLSRDTSGKFRPFPGATSYNEFVEILGTGSKLKATDNSGMIPACSTWVANPPESSRRFILHGKTGDWAVWADSIDASSRIRWRWSHIRPNTPWVRWIDELQLGQSQNPSKGTPLFTTLEAVRLGDLRPGLETVQGLTLHATPARGSTVEWAFRSGTGKPPTSPIVSTPSDSIPKGTLFRIFDAYKMDESDVQWSLPTSSTFIDNFCISGSGTSRLKPIPSGPLAVRMGMTAIEPSTGRKLVLDRPLPPGGRFLRDKNGARFVVVQ